MKSASLTWLACKANGYEKLKELGASKLTRASVAEDFLFGVFFFFGGVLDLFMSKNWWFRYENKVFNGFGGWMKGTFVSWWLMSWFRLRS